MSNKLLCIYALCVATMLTSCATVIRGVHDELKVVSTPAGADVQLSTGETGVTPTRFVKSRKDSFQVTISKPGYYSQKVNVESKGSATGGAATAGNIAIGGIIGIGVDAASGAWYSLYPNPVSVQLVPLREAAKRNSARIPLKEDTKRSEQSVTRISPAPEHPRSDLTN